MKIQANELEIHYELTGKVGGPVVVLSHSLGSTMTMWDSQISALEESYKVLRYDIRGHGGTQVPKGPYHLDELGDDAMGLLGQLNMEAVHFVGLSLGGMIGLNLALRFPRNLRSLALCDTTAILPVEAQPVWQERIQTARERGLGPLMQGTMERWFTQGYLEQDPPEVKQIRNEFLQTPVDGFIGCAQAIRELNYLDRLGEIHLPTLIIVGEDDPGTPPAASRAMHQRIPHSKLLVLPSAAHLSNIEQSRMFNDALVEFLREQER
jgi:3-oxoadipate enol-lactonase